MGKEIKLDLFEGHSMHLFLFENVSNTGDILQLLQCNQLEMALINPELLLDEFQLVIAGTKAYHNKMTNSLITKNVHSELVFVLAASKNV